MEKTEKRRSERRPVELRAVVGRWAAMPPKPPASVQTLNLSKQGALIESADPFVPEEVCTLSLLTSSAMNADLQGRIVWSEKIAESKYRSGVAFRNLTADEEYALDLQLARSAR